MKRIVVVVAALGLFWAPAHAQMTPEAVMGMTPDLPSTSALLQYYRESTAPDGSGVSEPNAISTFLEKWKEAQEQITEMRDKTLAPDLKQKAMNSKVAGSGKTAQKTAQMSEDEARQLAMSKMKGSLSALGLSQADIAKMQSGNLSEAEQKALADKVMAAQTGGLTTKDVEAMEQMSEQQRKEFMEESGLGASVSKKMEADKGKRATDRRQTELIQEMQRLNARVLDKQNEAIGKKDIARKEGKKLFNSKYAKRIESLEEAMGQAVRDGAGEEKYRDEDAGRVKEATDRYEALNKQRHAAMCEFYAEYIPMWRDAVSASMDCCRSELLPLLKEKQQVEEKLYSLTHGVEYSLSANTPFLASDLYFELSKDIVDFELDLP